MCIRDSFQRYTVIDSLTVTLISSLYCDPNGDMWIGNEKMGGRPGLIKFSASNQEFKRIPALSGIIPKAFVMDHKGILWIGSGQGVLAFRNDSIISTITQDD